MDFSIKDLDKVLEHKNIISTHYTKNIPGLIFKRRREVIINKKMYHITWYANQCYLYTSDLIIPFSYVKQTNTWPNNSKMNLQFYDKYKNVCCILALEKK